MSFIKTLSSVGPSSLLSCSYHGLLAPANCFGFIPFSLGRLWHKTSLKHIYMEQRSCPTSVTGIGHIRIVMCRVFIISSLWLLFLLLIFSLTQNTFFSGQATRTDIMSCVALLMKCQCNWTNKLPYLVWIQYIKKKYCPMYMYICTY